MNKKLLVLTMVPVFALAGCHGIRKVEFSKFAEKAKAVEEVKVSEVKVKGKVNDDKLNFEAKVPTSILDFDAIENVATSLNAKEAEIYMLVTSLKSVKTMAESESKDATYYVGAGFKVKSKDGKMEWNKKGLLVSYNAEVDDSKIALTVSWKLA